MLLFAFLSFARAFNASAETKKKELSYSGLYYGHLIDIRPDRSAVTVIPIDKSIHRQRFYVDKKTIVVVNGKRSAFTNLYYGDKVAVRYFATDKTAVADAIFVVFGDFVPKDYLPKKNIRVVKKEGKEGEGKEENAAEHGEKKAEKKAEKKGH